MTHEFPERSKAAVLALVGLPDPPNHKRGTMAAHAQRLTETSPLDAVELDLVLRIGRQLCNSIRAAYGPGTPEHASATQARDALGALWSAS
jgi:hypothetical protein